MSGRTVPLREGWSLTAHTGRNAVIIDVDHVEAVDRPIGLLVSPREALTCARTLRRAAWGVRALELVRSLLR